MYNNLESLSSILHKMETTVFKTAFLLGIILTSVLAEGPNSSENVPVPVPPMSPRLPNCGLSFPGTPEWNACWAEFQLEMSKFQQQMQQYGQQISAAASKDENGNFYSSQSQSFSSGMGLSRSSVMTNGYTIHASGIPISTFTQGSKIQIKLAVGNFDSFESKVEGREIEMKMKSEGQPRWAKIRVPPGVNLEEIKVERSTDTILISGPVSPIQGGNRAAVNQMSHGMLRSYVPGAMRHPMFMPMFSHVNFPNGNFNHGASQMWFF